MDFQELKQQAERITKELKDKAPEEQSLLVGSLSMIIKMMLGTCETLIKQNYTLTDSIKELQATIKDLQRQLGMNSQNSSKPPSIDGYKKANKNRSLREKTGRSVGRQKGYEGAYMKVPHEADEVKQHMPNKCLICPHYTECVKSETVFACTGESRFVIEAEVRTRVIEHQVVRAVNCPYGDKTLTGEFPKNVRAYCQYGNSVTVLAGLLSTYGAVSLDRIHILLGSLFNISLSPATICSMVKKCADTVCPVVEQVKAL